MKKFLLSLSAFIILYSTSGFAVVENWSNLNNGVSGGAPTSVKAMVYYNGNLVVAGNFNNADGLTANNIAIWDGVNWSTMGTGTNGEVRSLAVFNAELYVGGSFSDAGGIAVNNIAKWAAGSWSDVATGTDGPVNAMYSYGGELFVGGAFANANGISSPNIARWDGTNWNNVSTGVAGEVFSICSFGTDVIFGGAFTSPVSFLAQWNGTSISAIPGAPNGSVRALKEFGSNLYIGGNFSLPADFVVRWNGTTFDSIKTFNGPVNTFGIANNEIYIGGEFSVADSKNVNFIARLEGSEVYPLGLGADNYVFSLADFGGVIVAGGTFGYAGGGVLCNGIGRYTKTPPVAGFSANIDTLCAGNSVMFTDSSSNYPDSWEWSFPGGSPSSSSEKYPPSIYYYTPGIYNVTLTVTNNDGTNILNENAYIVVNEVPSLSFSKDDPSCTGGDGSATVNATGGVLPYTYSWNYGQTSQTLNNLNKGFYGVTVTDSSACSSYLTVELVDPPSFYINAIMQPAQCGISNGAIDANVSGGTPPFNYSWSNGATTEDISGLGYGNYTLTVTDSENCIDSSISNLAGLFDVAIIKNDITCPYYYNGNAKAVPGGGTPPFNYSWNTEAITDSIGGLGEGNVSVTVTDSLGCQGSASNYIYQPSSIYINFVSKPATCGLSNGTLTGNVSGGTPPYNYLWSDSSTLDSISGKPMGNYSLTITDNNGCTEFNSGNINGEFSVSISKTDVNCYGYYTGSATATVSGGTAPYSFNWNNGYYFSASINSLYAGYYFVNVTDTMGCIGTADIYINEPTPISGEITAVDANCGMSDGSATANISGGILPYTYSWSNGSTAIINSGIPAGTYNLDITDSNGCLVNYAKTIKGIFDITVSSITEPSCFGDYNGQYTINTGTGTTPFSFFANEYPTGNPAVNLYSGTYNIRVVDSSGCEGTTIVTLNEPPPLSVNISKTNATCGNPDGVATANAAGGTGAYNYLWSTSDSTQSISGLSAGNFSVTVTDQNGCISSASDSVYSVFDIDIIKADPLCPGGTGTAYVNEIGGVPPFVYFWSNGNSTDTTIAYEGGLNVKVTDNNGCTGLDTVVINSPVGMTVTLSKTNSSCGFANGTATAAVSGGTLPYTYNWDGVDMGSNSTLTGITSGYPMVSVTDSNGCYTEPISIFVKAELDTLNILVTQPTCYGIDNGIAAFAGCNGTPPFNITWSMDYQGDTLKNLWPGNYTMNVSDSANCSGTKSFTIAYPDQLSVSVSGSTQVCNGMNDGILNANVFGGTSPYSYLWNDSLNQTTASISNLGSGNYFVSVSDSNGCNVVSNVNSIYSGNVLDFSWSPVNNTCFGDCGGYLSTNITSGGSGGPYSYLWSNGSTDSVISGLCAGTYSLTLTDASGCNKTGSIVITQPDSVIIGFNSSPDICGNTNGTIDAIVSGGNPPYNYSWSNGATTAGITNLSAGSYVLSLADAQGCAYTDSTTVSFLSGPVLTYSLFHPICFGQINGSITSNVTGGTPPYIYNWNSGHSTASISGLAAGNYTLIVSDSVGCQDTISDWLVEPTQLSATISSFTDPTCNGNNDGSIQANVFGGTGPYSFQWDDPGSTTSSSVNNLFAGTYNLVVTDANGCTDNISHVLSEPSVINLTLSSTDAHCGQSDGGITSSINGGSGSYTYLWSNGDTTGTLSGVIADAYNLIVTDGNGCQDTSFATVNNISGPAAIIAGTNVLCNGGFGGAADLTVSGGSAPYTYSWSDATNIEDISELNAGFYSVLVTDNFGCQATDTIEITEPAPLSVSLTSADENCGSSNGSITSVVTGGTPGYLYSWSGGETTANISGVGSGSYILTVTDINGCANSDTAQINNIGGPGLSLTKTDVTCAGGNNGTISSIITGGTAPFIYSWSNGGTDSSLTGLSAGLYYLTATDNNGCNTSDTINLNEPLPISISLFPSDASCGNADGGVNSIVSDGTAPYNYSWSNGANSTSINAITSGNYTLIITDANGCVDSAVASVNDLGGPTLTASKADVSCFGGSNGMAAVSINGGTSPISVSWNTGDTTSSLAGIPAGIYSVTVTDANGCAGNSNITITEPNVLVVTAGATLNPICQGASTTLTGSGAVYYIWDNGATDGMAASPGVSTLYIVTGTDSAGCSATDSIMINVNPIPNIFINATTSIVCAGESTTLTGGGGVSYTWDNGITDGVAFIPVSTTTYTVTGTDINGCSGTNQMMVNVNSLPIVSANATASSICTGGSITLTGSGAATYAWDNGVTDGINFVPLATTTYTLTGTDGNGCSGTTTLNVTVNPLPVVLAGPDVSICSPGSITLNGSGANTYTWDNGVSDGVPFTATSTLTYTVTGFDLNGCSATDFVNVTVGNPLSVSLTPADETCGNSNGSITSAVTGGAGGNTYLWSNAATTGDILMVGAGSYQLTVTDSNGCTGTANTSISNFAGPVVSVTPVMVLCNGANTGSATATLSGGTGPFLFNWSNGATTADATSLSAGNYLVSVTDQNGCMDSINVTITEPALLSLSVNAANANCGLSNGTVTSTISGGTMPYNFSWNNGTTLADLNGVPAGNYILVITDANGCSNTSEGIVGNTDGPTITNVSTVSTSCPSVCDGSAGAMVSGGTLPYTYSWDNDQMISSANNLCIGSHSVTVFDQSGCMFTYQTSINTTGIDPAITGTVSISGGPAVAGMVEVIAQDNNDAVLEIVATAQLDSTGNYFIQDIPAGNYRIAAIADSLLYPNSVKTYLNMHYRWDLTALVSSNCNAVDTFDLELINVPPMNGNGYIQGLVRAGASGKRLVPGDPIPGVDITLEQNPGGIISSTVTDAAGEYQFESVPAGNDYSIFVDIPGLGMIATYDIDITGSDTVVNNNFFVDSTGTIDTVLNITGLKHRLVKEYKTSLSASPNPFFNASVLTITLAERSDVTLEVYDVRGILVETIKSGKLEKGVYNYRFENEVTSNGVYYVKMKSNDQQQFLKLVRTK